MKSVTYTSVSAVMRGTREDALNCFSDAYSVLNAVNRMCMALGEEPTPQLKKLLGKLDLDPLVEAEDLLVALDTRWLDIYQEGVLCSFPILHDRLQYFDALRNQLVKILEQIVLAYTDLTKDESGAVLALSKKILEQLSFFFFYEFGFDRILQCLKEDREVEVSEIVLWYAGKHNVTVIDLCVLASELFFGNRKTIPSFDFTDEEIDSFYFYTGFYAYTLLEDIDALPANVARALAHGELSPEDAIVQLGLAPDMEV